MNEDRSEGAASRTTQLLDAWRSGDRGAREELIGHVYSELRAIASHHLRGWRRAETWQPTALVNEALLRMLGRHDVPWSDRSHFLRVAAIAMRQILVDHARRSGAGKRGGGVRAVELEESSGMVPPGNIDVLLLDQALERLETLDPVQVKVVELRFFVGLSIDETAQVLDMHPSAINREWAMARAWLRQELGEAR